MTRTCPHCGVQGRWHSANGCGPCRKELARRPAPGRAEAFAARWAATAEERWVVAEDGLLYPKEHRDVQTVRH